MKQYDELVEAYESTKKHKLREFLEAPSVSHAIGDITGTRALDLACGAGWSTRLLKEQGAINIVGVDESEAQIIAAQEKDTQGIEYHVGDVFTTDLAKQFGTFDIITGVYCLHYAARRVQLESIVESIANALNPGGRFISVMRNPNITLPYHKGGLRSYPVDDTGETLRCANEFIDNQGKVQCRFKVYQWSRQVYQDIFMANFNQPIIEHPILLTDQSDKDLKAYQDDPCIMIWEAKK